MEGFDAIGRIILEAHFADDVHALAKPSGIDQAYGTQKNPRIFERLDSAPNRGRRTADAARQFGMSATGVALQFRDDSPVD